MRLLQENAFIIDSIINGYEWFQCCISQYIQNTLFDNNSYATSSNLYEAQLATLFNVFSANFFAYPLDMNILLGEEYGTIFLKGYDEFSL